MGQVSPGVFIPIAEQSGVIINVTKWLINEVCRQVSDWKNENFEIVPVAINISGIDLDQKNFHHYLIGSVVKHKIKPQDIELELTESALSDNLSQAAATAEYLANWGFSITLDDFGVGYSGLAKLTTFPIKTIKIDRQFIQNIHSSVKKEKVVEAMVAMCRVFNIEILAEGVECEEEVELVAGLGCNRFQGYYFAKPQSPKQLEGWFGQGRLTNVG